MEMRELTMDEMMNENGGGKIEVIKTVVKWVWNGMEFNGYQLL